MQKASTASPRSRFEQIETPPLNTDKPSEDSDLSMGGTTD